MLKRLFAAISLSVFVAPAANAMDHGWYWGIEAGIDRLSDLSEHETGVISSATYDFDVGPTAFVVVGGHLGPQLRLEAELGYRMDNFAGYSGNWNEGTLLGNVIYDFPLAERVTASVGAGLGADLISGSGQSDTGFAYQFLGGLSWAIAPSTDLTLQFRYTVSSGPTFDGGMGTLDYSDLHHQTATIGLRFAL